MDNSGCSPDAAQHHGGRFARMMAVPKGYMAPQPLSARVAHVSDFATVPAAAAPVPQQAQQGNVGTLTGKHLLLDVGPCQN